MMWPGTGISWHWDIWLNDVKRLSGARWMAYCLEYRARSASACFAAEVITESGHGHQRPFISCPWRWRYPDLASEKESQTNQVSGVMDPFFFKQIFRECTSYCFTVIAVRQTNDTHQKKRITSNIFKQMKPSTLHPEYRRYPCLTPICQAQTLAF